MLLPACVRRDICWNPTATTQHLSLLGGRRGLGEAGDEAILEYPRVIIAKHSSIRISMCAGHFRLIVDYRHNRERSHAINE